MDSIIPWRATFVMSSFKLFYHFFSIHLSLALKMSLIIEFGLFLIFILPHLILFST